MTIQFVFPPRKLFSIPIEGRSRHIRIRFGIGFWSIVVNFRRRNNFNN